MKLINQKDTHEFISNGVIKRKLHGYIFIKIGLKFVPEHRLVVEELLHRNLTDSEVVHHIDSNRMNNELSNLMLFPNQKAHAHFHRQIKQFGMTNPRIREIEGNIIQVKLKQTTV